MQKIRTDNMQYLPWVVILLLIYAIYFLMIRYEKRMDMLSKLIEQNRDNIKQNKNMIEKNRTLIEKNKTAIEENSKNISASLKKIETDIED